MRPFEEPVPRVRPERWNSKAVISCRGSSGPDCVGGSKIPALPFALGSQSSTVPNVVPNARRLWLSSAIAPVLTAPVLIPPCKEPPPLEVKSSPPTSTSKLRMYRPSSRFRRKTSPMPSEFTPTEGTKASVDCRSYTKSRPYLGSLVV